MEQATKEVIEQFFRAYPLQRFKRFESVIREGDVFDKIYLLHSGFVRLYTLFKTGKEINLFIYTPGDFFPMFLATHTNVSQYYFEALTPIEVYSAPVQEFVQFAKKSASLLYDLTKKAGKVIAETLRRLEYLATESSYSNVCSVLTYLYTIYIPFTKKKSGYCEIPFSHQEISSWVYNSRETVTRQMQKLTKKGIIAGHHRSIIIKNLSKLNAELMSSSST